MRAGLVLIAVLVCTATVTGYGVRAAPTPTDSSAVAIGSSAVPGRAVPGTIGVSAGPVTSVGDRPIPQTEGSSGPVSAPGPIDPARSNLTVRLQPNGDAAWVVEVAIPLSGRNETRAFRDLGARYEAGRAEVGPQVAPFERALGAASEGIEREMSLFDVSRSARVENGTGYLTLAFLWTNFASESGGRLRVGDAFSTPRGTWLPGLAANQSLVLVPPPGYGVNSAPIGPDNGTLRWEGPQEFEPGYLSVTYRRGLRDSTTSTTRTTPAPDTQDGLLPLAGATVLGVVLLVALYARSRGSFPALGDVDADTSANDESGGASQNADGTAVATDELDGSDAAAGADELLSDEERVERLLRENGGRMRQAAIVSETRWSNAKVSQLLSAMDREDRVDKLRIGRENLISLPDADTDDVDE